MWQVVGTAAILACVQAVFFYSDFNETLGLTLNGNAATSNCIFKPINEYRDDHGEDDKLEAQLDVVQTHSVNYVSLETTDTSVPSTTSRIAKETAMFSHRDTYNVSVQTECPVRLRLTASQPHQASSVWYNDQLNVLDGFETRFTFQISDHSRRCYDVKDQNFGLRAYQSCFVHGGDGFAFVIQGHPNTLSALGSDGQGLGWDGITNSIAVVFDTWPHSEPSSLLIDRVSIQLAGSPRKLLSIPMPVDIADGTIHIVKVRYYNSLPLQYLAAFSATENIVDLLKDMGEERHMGCLVVFMDDGITQGSPVLAVPLNLAVTLQLPEDKAYIGFTSATGNAWEKHDILAWYYCAQPPCLDVNGNKVALEFDYSSQSILNPVASYGTSLYPQLIFPDTNPWGYTQEYFAPGVPTGVS
ncbi:unnamed protein product [Aphanomyces euteiches]